MESGIGRSRDRGELHAKPHQEVLRSGVTDGCQVTVMSAPCSCGVFTSTFSRRSLNTHVSFTSRRSTPVSPETFCEVKSVSRTGFAKFADGHASPESPVFTTRIGGPLSHRNVSRGFDQIRKDAGLDVTFHDLRDFLASKLIHEGVPATDVARRMGHKNAAVTLTTYAKAFNKVKSSKQVREAMAK